MYTTYGYVDTLMVQLSLIPFITNWAYGHDHVDENDYRM
jgi:hypothetical protein